jgi:hypothetical protein
MAKTKEATPTQIKERGVRVSAECDGERVNIHVRPKNSPSILATLDVSIYESKGELVLDVCGLKSAHYMCDGNVALIPLKGVIAEYK